MDSITQKRSSRKLDFVLIDHGMERQSSYIADSILTEMKDNPGEPKISN